MPRALLAKRYFDEEDGLYPEQLINTIALPFKDPDKNAPWKVTAVPGCSTIATSSHDISALACRALAYDPNAIETDLCGVFGNDFVTIASNWAVTDAGDVASSTRQAKLVAGGSRMAILSATTLYSWDGSTFAAVTDSDLPGSGTGIEDICYIGGRFIALDADTEKYFYSDSGSLANWTALGYINAEVEPDFGVACVVDNDDLILLGRSIGEVFGVTTNADSPYQRRIGAIINQGCLARDSVTRADNGVFFAADDCTFRRLNGYTAVRVSERDLEKAIEALSAANQSLIEAQTFVWRGQTIIQVSLPSTGTWWFNAATGEWTRRATASVNEALCRIYPLSRQKGGAGRAYGKLVTGGRTGGLYEVTASAFTDGASAITRTFTAFIPSDEAGKTILNVVLSNTPGRAASGTPEWSLVTSINGGRTWKTARTASFGTTGAYNQRSVWAGLGEVGSQGMVLKFSTSAAAADDVIAVRYNVDLAAR